GDVQDSDLQEIACGAHLPVWRQGNAVGVFTSRSLVSGNFFFGAYVPNFGCFVHARRSQRLAVWRKRYRSDPALVPPEGTAFLTGFHLPQFDRGIPTRGGHRFAVRRNGKACYYRTGVAAKGSVFLTGADIPQSDCSICAAGHQDFPVPSECHASYRFGVTLES